MPTAPRSGGKEGSAKNFKFVHILAFTDPVAGAGAAVFVPAQRDVNSSLRRPCETGTLDDEVRLYGEKGYKMNTPNTNVFNTNAAAKDGASSSERPPYEAPRLERHDSWEVVTGQFVSPDGGTED